MKIRYLRSAFVLCALTSMLLIQGAIALQAQVSQPDPAYTSPVDSVLARFERESRAVAVNNIGLVWIIRVFHDPSPSVARRDSLLDGLERLARVSNSSYVRQSAASTVALAGDLHLPRTTPGVVARLARIYAANDEQGPVRLSIRRRMTIQAERRAAAAFLRSVAIQEDPSVDRQAHPMSDPRIDALSQLTEMGEEGRAVLQEMHRRGEVRSPQVRAKLEYMARSGFPVRDARRPQP